MSTRPGHPILAIFNGTVTGREVGSTADIFGDIGDYDESIYQNKDYINQLVLSRDGRTLKSSTFNIVGEDYHFALGINLDITNMVRAGQMLSELTATSGDLQQTLMQDARSQLEELLRECISAVGKEPEAMKKTDRMRIIRMLYKRRAFTYQKSVAIVAERLNVSRYTVYKYMHELEEAEAVKAQVKAGADRLAQLEEMEEKLSNMESANTTVAIDSSADAGDGRDVYFADAARLLMEKEKGSIGMLQRYFKIGFNRAARIMDQLEEAGIVGPEEGTKPRRVLMSPEQFEQYEEEYL